MWRSIAGNLIARSPLTVATRALAAMACMLLMSEPAWAQSSVRLSDDPDGTTCRLISVTAGIPWRKKAGDWRDAEGNLWGNTPFSVARIAGRPLPQSVDWDATTLLRNAISRHQRSADVLLRLQGGGEALALHSRESTQQALRPALILNMKNGPPVRIAAEADTTLDCSTYSALGGDPNLRLDGIANIALSFAIPSNVDASELESATLRLAPESLHGAGIDVGTFELSLPSAVTGPPIAGVASKYRNDSGIGSDPSVLFAEDFESETWYLRWGMRFFPSLRAAISSGNLAWLMWGMHWFRGHFETVGADPPLRFEALSGKALSITIKRSEHLGIDLRYYIRDHLGYEPEEAYLRYYLRFGDDWQPGDGGKLPGLAGTYGRAGWGDRPVNGTDGWSMRGNFSKAGPAGDQFAGLNPVGSYLYLPDSESAGGIVWSWYYAGLGLLRKNRWYCIEQYVKLNAPGKNNGEFRAWVDGHLASEKTGLRYRDTDKLKIETAWFDVYYGGLDPTPKDLHLYIDNVVLAKTYIGPMAR